jgi:hypothetical protein
LLFGIFARTHPSLGHQLTVRAQAALNIVITKENVEMKLGRSELPVLCMTGWSVLGTAPFLTKEEGTSRD